MLAVETLNRAAPEFVRVKDFVDPFESILKSALGVAVPTPTFPPFVTTKFVTVEEPIANAGPAMPFGFMESCAHGVEVPIPRF